MKQSKTTIPLRWRRLLALLLCLSNQVVGQTLPQPASGISDAMAKIISFSTVGISLNSRPPACEPWKLKSIISQPWTEYFSRTRDYSFEAKISSQALSDSNQIAVLSLFQSLSDDKWPVPDPSIAVGRDHVLAAVNSKLALYDKCGNLLFTTTLEAWFESVLDITSDICGPFNPRVLYNHFDSRWLLAALATDTQTKKSYILFSVSWSDDPTENWYAWALDMSQDGSTPTGLQAYHLTLGLSANTIFLSTNQYDTPEFRYAKVRLLSISDITDGGNVGWWDVWGFQGSDKRLAFSVVPPICFDQVDTVLCVETRPIIDSLLTLWEVRPNPSVGPIVKQSEIRIPTYTRPDLAPQPESRDSLGIGDARIQAAILRNGVLWTSFSTGGAGITAVGSQIRIIGFNIKNGSFKFDSSRTVDDQSHFMPGLIVNRLGNLGSFYYSSSAHSRPAFEALIHDFHSGKPFPQARIIIKESLNSFISTDSDTAFWGQHVGIALDPTDETTFWGIGEVVDNSNERDWTTWIGAISLSRPKPDLMIQGDTSSIKIARGSEQRVPLIIRNSGLAFTCNVPLGAYFSTDQIWSRETDTLIDSTTLKFLNAGSDQEIDFKYTIRNNILVSKGFLIFVVDNRNEVMESDESNNAIIRPVKLSDSLKVDAEILSPPPKSPFCSRGILVTGRKKISGGFPGYVDSCWVNGKLVKATRDTFTISLNLSPGDSTLILICKVMDSCGNSARDTASVTIISDVTGPTFKWGYSPVYPYIKGNVRDPDTGIKSLWASFLQNARFSHDNFDPGVHEVAFQIEPIDASQPIGFILNSNNMAGCVTIIDPLIVRITAEQGSHLVSLNVPVVDHFFNIENHGLSQITLKAADTEYHFVADVDKRGRQGDTFYIPFEGGFTTDLQDLWQDENLEVTLVGAGFPSQYAYIIFSDKPWSFTTQLEDRPQQDPVPVRFTLHQCYPNPFNPETKIRFEIPPGEPRYATLRIYNLQGQLVTTLLDTYVLPGYYELSWRGLDKNGSLVSSGVYFYSLQADNFHATRKMTFTK